MDGIKNNATVVPFDYCINFDQFEQSSSNYAEISAIKPDTEVIPYDHCPDCKLPMSIISTEYRCDICGQTKMYVCAFENAVDKVHSSIRICTGPNKGRFYNIANDYQKTQKKIILDQLMQNHANFKGSNNLPINVLRETASQYNIIQTRITEDDIDSEGKLRGKKKFVRRGNIKDEVLAALIYFECIRVGLVRKKIDIAVFMKLSTNGFSRGEDILRSIQAEGGIDIPIDEEPVSGYIERYLESLNIEQRDYELFTIELVAKSEELLIGMTSQLSSKVVGAVWIIVTHCDLRISANKVESACDNTKKNTFTKFSKLVHNNIELFQDIFNRYKIPLVEAPKVKPAKITKTNKL